MKEKFIRFMSGRYGMDQLGTFLNIVSIVLLLIGIFTPSIVTALALAVLVYSYFRVFSRDRQKRITENLAYLRVQKRVKDWFATRRKRFENRGEYRYLRCPNCHQDLRIPRGKGTIVVTCPKCGNKFEKKS